MDSGGVDLGRDADLNMYTGKYQTSNFLSDRILPLEVIGNRIKADVMATLNDDKNTKLITSRRKSSTSSPNGQKQLQTTGARFN